MTGKSLHTFLSFLWIVVLTMLRVPSCDGQGSNYLNCPSSTSISPCTCGEFRNYYYRPYGEGLSIDCAGKSLSDSQMSRILDNLLAPGLSPIVQILASFNQLTKVPKQISILPALSFVDFNNNRISEIESENGRPFLTNRLKNGTAIDIYLSNNRIKRIPSGVFDFPNAKYIELNLTDNRISSISSGAFRSSSMGIKIYLSRNKLNDLPAGVFNFPSAYGVIIDLDYNEISAIPSAAFNFSLARHVDISFDSNKISSIPVNAFNFTSISTEGIIIRLSRNHINAINCGTYISLTLRSIEFYLSYNQIEKIPKCAFIFPSATGVTLDLENNLITTISPGAFYTPSASISLLLSNNQISAIPPDTFSQGEIYTIRLSNNKLTRFESSVFKTALNSILFPSAHSSVNITGNPIDCSTDPCHLAWLLKSTNSSQLLSRISADGICSSNGGSPFSTLNSFDFSKNCACSYN